MLSPGSLSDGSYARAVAAARGQLARDLGAAQAQHARETRSDVAALRARTGEPALQRYLDAVGAASSQAEADAAAGKAELPRSFWPATIGHR